MIEKAREWIDKAVKHLDFEFWKLQLGRANPAIIEDITVETYWALWPLKNSASITLLDPQTLNIKPWDMTIIWTIAKAISNSWMWFNPQVMADWIIIKIPTLTEERRIEISKIAKRLSEDAKVSVRNVRWEVHKMIKKAEDDKEITEDESKDLSSELQKLIDDANKKIEEHYKHKDAEIMKV